MSDIARTAESFLVPFASRDGESRQSRPDWWDATRTAALERFAVRGFPTPRQEAWRSTNVMPVARTRFQPAPMSTALTGELPRLASLESGIARLLFIDGRMSAPHGLSLPSGHGLWVGSLARALEQIPERLREPLGHGEDEDASTFDSLNTALCEDGGVILVDDGVVLDRPIHLVYVSTAAGDSDAPTASFPRTTIVAGRSSRVVVIESYLAANGGPYLTNPVTAVHVGAGAEVRHYRIQAESEQAFHISSTRSRQGPNSRYTALNVNLGGRLVRNDLRAVLDGEGGNCTLDGLYLTRGAQHLDNHTTIDHAKPGCDSREVYKGVLGGDSRAVFSGRIIVRPDAQRTDAKQSNPNLLLSRDALASTRPQLEIYADDVKCTHGATVGRLDEEAIFYLRSRAIPDDQARDLLVSAFADEVLDRIEIDPLRGLLQDIVAQRLPGMKG